MSRRSRIGPKLLVACIVPPVLITALACVIEACLAWSRPAPVPPWRVSDDGTALVRTSTWPKAVFHVPRIPVSKPAGTTRLLCLGGSTTFGHPFEPPGAFSDWLALRLTQRDPDGAFEVFNLGSNGLDSESVVDLAHCVMATQPDWLVVSMGHNEFLDPHLHKVRKPWVHEARRRLRHWRLGAWLFPPPTATDDATRARAQNAPAVHDEPRVTPAQRERGHRRFGEHVQALVQLCRTHDVQLVLCHPVSDLVDTPPQWSWFSQETPPDVRRQFLETCSPVGTFLQRLNGPNDASLDDTLDRLAALDADVPLIDWRRGRVALAAGDSSAARSFLERARERDGHPIRAGAPVHAAIEDAAGTGVWVADAREAFHAAGSRGLAGQDGLFVDYCHPTLEGHRLLADTILDCLEQGGIHSTRRLRSEPAVSEQWRALGIDPAHQAVSFARRALAVLAQSYFATENPEALAAARNLLRLALAQDRDCALAHAGEAFVACLEGRADDAADGFARAETLDPESLAPFVQAATSNAVVRDLLGRSGLQVRGGRIERLPP